MLCPKSDGVLIGREAMGHLSTNSSVSQGIHCMIVGCSKRVTLLVPASINDICIKQRIYILKRVHLQRDTQINITYIDNEAMRSALEKLTPALHLAKFPVFVSNEISVPSARTLDPMVPEKLTTGFAVNPMLELIPA